MNKWSLILLVSLGFLNNTIAQNYKEELSTGNWYVAHMPGNDSLVLKSENASNTPLEFKLKPSGKLSLKDSKKNIADSSYGYNFRKNMLVLHMDLKDSVKTFAYLIKKNKTSKTYQLTLDYSEVYKKRRGDDTVVVRELSLVRNKDVKTIYYQEDLTVFGQKKGLRHDSVDFAVWGQFVGYKSDTIIIDSDQFVKHNFYKKHTDSMHYYSPLLLDTIIRIKLPIKEITGIYKEREPFSTVMTRITVSGIGVGLVCMVGSLVSGETHAANVFAQVATASFLTVPVSFGLGLGFSKQKFRLHGGEDPAKLWRIGRHKPGANIKIPNTKKRAQKK